MRALHSAGVAVTCALLGAAAALAGVEAVGGPGGDPPIPDASYVLPRKVKAKPNTQQPELGQLTLNGLLDTGPDAADLAAAATLEIGGWSLAAAGLQASPSGKLFTFEDEGLLLRLKASPFGSSKVVLKLKATANLDGLLLPDVDNDVAFTSSSCEGTSTVTLEGLTYTLGKKPGTLVAPALYLQAARAKVGGPAGDTLRLRLGVATGGEAPPAAPDVTVGFGEFSELVPGAAFTRVGSKDVYVGSPGGLTSVVLDHAGERLVVKAVGVDLGPFADGGNAVTVWVQLGEAEGLAVAVRMVKQGAALKY